MEPAPHEATSIASPMGPGRRLFSQPSPARFKTPRAEPRFWRSSAATPNRSPQRCTHEKHWDKPDYPSVSFTLSPP